MNSELKRRIEEIAHECSVPGWDGYGANAVTGAAIAEARVFAEAIGSSLLVPEVGAEPDGALTFEWHRSARLTLSVSVPALGCCITQLFLALRRLTALNRLLVRYRKSSLTSYRGLRPHEQWWDMDRAREMMEHHLMTAQIRVHDLDMDEILAQAVPENLSQAVRDFGNKLQPKVLQRPVGVSER